MKIKKICLQCKKEFFVRLSRKNSAKFCSNNCFSEYNTIETKCKRCGKIFKVSFSKIKKGRGKYCSKKCQYGDSKIKKKCFVCNKEYFVYKYRKNTAKCCSKECWYKYNKGKTSVNYGREMSDEAKVKISKANKGIKRSKKTCKKMSIAQSQRKKNSCSEKTKIKIGIANKGKNNGQWKGGITPLRIIIWKSDKSQEWRSSVFERDNFTCQMPNCDKIEKFLNAHHINEFRKIIKKNNIKTIEDAIECEELWDTNNGITLCKKCHGKTKMKEEQYAELFKKIVKINNFK